MKLQAPPAGQAIVGAGGRPVAAFLDWLSELASAVNAATARAAASAPTTTRVTTSGGLHLGGSLQGDIALTFYLAICPVAQLPKCGLAPGDWAYALDARKPGESTGGGTGMPVFWSNTTWFDLTGAPAQS